MNKSHSRTWAALACSGLLIAFSSLATAQAEAPAYPSRPIKVIVGVSPGGSTDRVARLYADWLQKALGQPTAVENKPGINTIHAADHVARSAPDGHTILVATDAIVTIPFIAKVRFDPLKDFIPVGTVALNRFVLAVHPSFPAKTLSELIEQVKARPGHFSYGSAGNGSSAQLGIEKLKSLTGMELLHIPYKGAGAAMSDAISGQYQISLLTPLALGTNASSGRLRPLAQTGSTRSDVLPDTPTFIEAGLKEYNHSAWQAVFVPAHTPPAVVARLRQEIQKMLQSPEVLKTLQANGVEPYYLPPQEVTQLLISDAATNAKLVKNPSVQLN